MPNKNNYTTAQAAKILGVSEDTARSYFRDGKIAGKKVKSRRGGKPRIEFDAASLKAFHLCRTPTPASKNGSLDREIVVDEKTFPADIRRRVLFIVAGLQIGEFSPDEAAKRIQKACED